MAPAPLTPHIENVEEFLSHCHRRRYPAKSTIIYAGDQGDTLYYIIKGSVTVMIEDDSDGKEIILAYLNPGDFFGEMGLLTRNIAVPGFALKPSAKLAKSATQSLSNSAISIRHFYLRSASRSPSDFAIPPARSVIWHFSMLPARCPHIAGSVQRAGCHDSPGWYAD